MDERRAAFEKWARANVLFSGAVIAANSHFYGHLPDGWDLSKLFEWDGENYKIPVVQAFWECWQDSARFIVDGVMW